MPRKGLEKMVSRFDSSSEILSGLKDDILWLMILIYSFKVRARLEGLGQKWPTFTPTATTLCRGYRGRVLLRRSKAERRPSL
jgi:hypothetical protein